MDKNIEKKTDNLKRFYEFERLMDNLYEFSQLLAQYQNTARQYGTDEELYMTEVHTLRIIGRAEGITMTEIAVQTHKTKGAVSQTIEKLVEKGFVVKHQDPEDKRRFILLLTNKGKIVYDFHEALDNKNYGEILEKMGDVNIESLKMSANIIRNIIDWI